MRIAAPVSYYVPTHCGGGEVMLHAILRDQVARGHDVTVLCERARTETLDGVKIVKARPSEFARLAAGADVVISHLKIISPAVAMAGRRPVVQLLHRDGQQIHPGATLVIANSEWLAREHHAFGGELVVVRPPVWVAEYGCEPAAPGAVTLVNLTAAKGGHVFWDLAATMPERRFLAVMGAHGAQIVRKAGNVDVVAHTPNIVSDVYARTRVLLMPSQTESWGRVAIEAACSGIPVLANPTRGLVEALGPAGLFVDRRDLRQWRHAIEALDDPDTYRIWSDRARARAVELDSIARDDLDRLEERLTVLAAA